MKKNSKLKVFVAVCNSGCTHEEKPRQLEQQELFAHEDKHIHYKARALIRMMKDATLDVRQQVMDYLTRSELCTKPVFSDQIKENS